MPSASIYKRIYPSKVKGRKPRIVWWIQYRVGGKLIRKSLDTSSRRIADNQLTLKKAALLKPSYEEPKRTRVDTFWPAYIQWMKDNEKAPATIALHENFWALLMEYTGATYLQDINSDHIEAFKVWMRKRPKARKRKNTHRRAISAQTVNNALKDLRTIFNRATDLGYYSGKNPVSGVKRFKLAKRNIDYHSEEEARRLIQVVTKDNPTLDERNLEWVVLLGLCAGLRRNEIVNLRWQDLKFAKKPAIEIRERDDFKIKTREARTLPMSKQIYDAMRPHSKKSGFVFKTNRASTGRSRYRFDPKKGLVAALEKAGFRTDSPFQNLRRTFGSIHVQHGKSYEIVSQWMGNSAKVVERYYAGLNPEDEDINVF